MTVFVDAWDTRTGQKVRNANGGKVPLSWFKNGLAERFGLAMQPPEPAQHSDVSGQPADPPAETPPTGARSTSAARGGKKEQ